MTPEQIDAIVNDKMDEAYVAVAAVLRRYGQRLAAEGRTKEEIIAELNNKHCPRIPQLLNRARADLRNAVLSHAYGLELECKG